jgi:hypothetical protein
MVEAAHCQITRVRMKNGGADVRLLPRGDLDTRQKKLLAYARQQAVQSAPLAGFILITWDFGGGRQVSADVERGDLQPIPRTLLAAWAEEAVRTEVITRHQIGIVLEDDYNIRPRPDAEN